MFYLHNTATSKYCQGVFTKKIQNFLYIYVNLQFVHNLEKSVEKRVNFFTVFTVEFSPQHKPIVGAKALILKGFLSNSQFSHQ